MPHVVNTHALVWYFTRNPRLSARALQIFRDSTAGREIVVVPIIVLAEILYISEKGSVPVSFEDVLEKIESGDNYEIAALDSSLLKRASEIKADLGLHDRLIVATAKTLGIPLVSHDKAIMDTGLVEVVW